MSTEHINATVEDARRAIEDPEVRKAVESPSFTTIVNAAQDEAVQEVLGQLPRAVGEAKAGYKTTEFWLALAGVISTQAGALSLPGEHGTTIATIAFVVAYVLSRGVAKAGVPNITST